MARKTQKKIDQPAPPSAKDQLFADASAHAEIQAEQSTVAESRHSGTAKHTVERGTGWLVNPFGYFREKREQHGPFESSTSSKRRRRIAFGLSLVVAAIGTIAGILYAAGVFGRKDKARTSAPHVSPVFVVFPREQFITNEGLDTSTRGTSGKDDTLDCRMVWSAEEQKNNCLMSVERYGEQFVLRIGFKHDPIPESRESYWSVAIGLKPDAKGLNWQGVDLTVYDEIVIDAKAESDDPSFYPSPPVKFRLRVRLEDTQVLPGAGARASRDRQSTNWSDFYELSTSYQECRFRLNDFRWDKSAWPKNRADVDRTSVMQVTIGHEGEDDPKCEGRIAIRSIRLVSTRPSEAASH